MLDAAEADGYAVLITVDKGIPFQNRLAGRTLAVIAVQTRSNRLEDLAQFVEVLEQTINRIGRGEFVRVP